MTAEIIFKTRWRNGFLLRFFVFVFKPFGNFEFEIDVFFGKNIQFVANSNANAKMTLVVGSSTFFRSKVYQVDSSNASPLTNYFPAQLFLVLSETRSYRNNK